MTVRIAVFGATGEIGREILNALDERGFTRDEVIAVGTRKSINREVSFGDVELKMKDVEGIDWSQVPLCLMSVGETAAKEWAPKIAAAGCIVVDDSAAFRLDAKIPLVVPEINAEDVTEAGRARLVSSPHPLSVQIATVLAPLHRRAGVERVVVATYQAVSDAGKEAMEELWNQTKGIFVNQEPKVRAFPKQIAFNVIPQTDEIEADGGTIEERQVRLELQRLIDPDMGVAITCVRTPVFVGHAAALHIELASPLTAAEARALLRESPGLMVVDKSQDGGFVTPVECVGEWAVYVSRIREDASAEHGLALWTVADNLRKGAALNMVQIAEIALNRKGLVQSAPGAAEDHDADDDD